MVNALMRVSGSLQGAPTLSPQERLTYGVPQPWERVRVGQCCLCGISVRDLRQEIEVDFNRIRGELADKARTLMAEAAQARRDDGAGFYHWLGLDAEGMEMPRFSTLHMCANVWRAAAVMVGADLNAE